MIDTTKWGSFTVGELFRLIPTKGKDSTELTEGDEISYIGAKKNENGLMMRCQLSGFEDWVSDGNCVVFVCLGAGSAGYVTYQEAPFIGMEGKTICGYNERLNPINALFIVTILDRERPKYSFGRSWTGDRLKNTEIRLPITSEGEPDWDYMEQYIKGLRYKPLSTANAFKNKPALNVARWKAFCVKELFDVKYGINMELNACVEAADDDDDAVNFVARTESDNGVSARVKRVEGKEPQPAGLITCAGGGSVLSTFLQEKPFYSGRDLYLLIPLYPMSKHTKLFCITVLKANRYRYSYGRQANITLPYLELMLPSTEDGTPDFDFMENYIKSLPYGDRI